MQITTSTNGGNAAYPVGCARDNRQQSDPHEATDRDEAVKITLSEEARAAVQVTGSGDAPTQLPDILVQATQRDGNLWKAKLPRFQPWTQETERQFQSYMSGRLALANQAFELAADALSTQGSVSYDDFHKALDILSHTAYKALDNQNKFVDGPGSDDMTARDFLNMLRNTDIVLVGGGSPASAGEFSIVNSRGRVEIYPGQLTTRYPTTDRDLAFSSVLFHELGHAVAPGRADAETTWDAFVNSHPGLKGLALENAYAASNERTALEARTSSRGWGLSEIAGYPFDTNIDRAGVAPR